MFVLIKVVEEFHYDTKHVREVGRAAACSTALPIPTIDFSIVKITSSPNSSNPSPSHLFFSSLHFILRLSRECIADASRWKIFIGTRARSYVGNVNHKRRLREILIDSRGQLNCFLSARDLTAPL